MKHCHIYLYFCSSHAPTFSLPVLLDIQPVIFDFPLSLMGNGFFHEGQCRSWRNTPCHVNIWHAHVALADQSKTSAKKFKLYKYLEALVNTKISQ